MKKKFIMLSLLSMLTITCTSCSRFTSSLVSSNTSSKSDVSTNNDISSSTSSSTDISSSIEEVTDISSSIEEVINYEVTETEWNAALDNIKSYSIYVDENNQSYSVKYNGNTNLYTSKIADNKLIEWDTYYTENNKHYYYYGPIVDGEDEMLVKEDTENQYLKMIKNIEYIKTRYISCFKDKMSLFTYDENEHVYSFVDSNTDIFAKLYFKNSKLVKVDEKLDQGNQDRYVWSNINSTVVEKPTKTLHNHAFGEWSITSSPCIEYGGEIQRTCSTCNSKEEKVLPALNSTDYTVTVTKAATCEENGVDTYTYIIDGQSFDFTALTSGHTYVNGVCKCGKKEPISDSDAVFIYHEQSYILSGYYGNKTEIIVPNIYKGLKVTGIGSHCFISNTSITSIELQEGITSIGDYAFAFCSNLKHIELPNTILEIKHSAFSNCSSLTSITIPDTVAGYGSYMFDNCSSLKSIILPKSFYNNDTLLGLEDSTIIYYKGTSTQWNSLNDISSVTNTVYFYSETKPTTSGNYWHYVDGVVTIWETNTDSSNQKE